MAARTEEQNRLLQPACRDLSQLDWHGIKLDADSWRHLICGTVLGWRMVRAINNGDGASGFVMLGGSSKALSKAQCTEALTMIFEIGDQPWTQGIESKPVRWCETVCAARGINYELEDSL